MWETSAATIKVRWRSCHAPTPQAGNTNGRTAYPAFEMCIRDSIKGLGKNLKKPGMLIVQDAVWNTVTINLSLIHISTS